MARLFESERFDKVIHLAAQAGVRYGSENPNAYIDSNIVGTQNILEGCRHTNVQHLVLASSSSVYGANTAMPFSMHDNVDHPVSLYAATKKANELAAHAYAHLYRLAGDGAAFLHRLRSVGPARHGAVSFHAENSRGRADRGFQQRPSRARFHLHRRRRRRRVAHGRQDRRAQSGLGAATSPIPATSSAPYRLYNIGNNNPVALMDFIAAIEKALGREAKKVFLPMQPGDVPKTFANVDDLVRDVGFKPSTPLTEGIARFVAWYRSYYG